MRRRDVRGSAKGVCVHQRERRLLGLCLSVFDSCALTTNSPGDVSPYLAECLKLGKINLAH